MNHLYNQKAGDCTMCALMNCVEIRRGKFVPYKEVQRLFDLYKNPNTQAVDFNTFRKDLGELTKYGIKGIEEVWNRRRRKFGDIKKVIEGILYTPVEGMLTQTRSTGNKRLMDSKRDGVIIVIRFGKEKQIETKEGKYVLPEAFRAETHAMCLFREGTNELLLENSWGPKFGLDGFFTMSWELLPKACELVWRIKF